MYEFLGIINLMSSANSSTFQPSEEGRSVQRLKRCDKHGDNDEDNSPKNVNNGHNTSSQKYRQKHYPGTKFVIQNRNAKFVVNNGHFLNFYKISN